MSAQCVTGKPKPRRLFKRRQPNAYQAQRIRFGLLAARDTLARDRMTPEQIDYLEACELHGWIVGDAGTLRAYNRENLRIQAADFWAGWGK